MNSLKEPDPLPIGIVAPSSCVPPIELRLGLEFFRHRRFLPMVHSQVKKRHHFFAGTDEERAHAVYEAAKDPRHSVVWCARGGYGAMRILPHLERLTRERGVPQRKKLLVGFSDATALMSYVQVKWNWAALHAPMPGFRRFGLLNDLEWDAIRSWCGKIHSRLPWKESMKLKFATSGSFSQVRGALVGGNLTVWASLIGTPYLQPVRDRIVFLEDVDENLFRLDRMVQQLLFSGSLRGAKAIILGNFLGCVDQVTRVLAKKPSVRNRERMLRSPSQTELQPLRKSMDEKEAIPRIFAQIGKELGIPVAFSLPVGHGPEQAPLPLGAEYCLHADGKWELIGWDWASQSP